jgi:hypothetical protein
VILTIPAIAYVYNRDFVREAGVEVERIAANAGQPNAAPLTLAELEPVRTRVEQLRKWETGAEMVPLYMRFGMYKGTEIYPASRSSTPRRCAAGSSSPSRRATSGHARLRRAATRAGPSRRSPSAPPSTRC